MSYVSRAGVEEVKDPIDPAVPDELRKEVNSIFVEFLGYLTYSEDDSIEVESKHNALDAIVALFTQYARQARLDELKTLARKHWQTAIPEQAVLDRIAQLTATPHDPFLDGYNDTSTDLVNEIVKGTEK